MADVLGRVERLERAGEHVAGHARAGVGDADRHILPRLHVGLRRRVALVEIDVGGLDRQLAALGHGVAGVDGKIENADLELGRIGVHPPHAAGEHGFDDDLLAERAPEKVGHAADEATEIDGFGSSG